MNYKTILMASAAVVFAGSAMAADLTNPFYAPTEGKFSSDTTLEHSRLKFKHHFGVVKDTALEKLYKQTGFHLLTKDKIIKDN